MTYEEAKQRLENSACSIAMEEAIDIAIEALEKQIPMKPIHKEYNYCPRCDIILDRSMIFGRYDFCPNCGQAIDWSDDE